MCRYIYIPAAPVAFFGDAFLTVDKILMNGPRTFDENSWMLTYRYPRRFTREVYRSKDKTTETLTKYFQLPGEARLGACHYIRSMKTLQRESGISARDIAVSMQLFNWVWVRPSTYRDEDWRTMFLVPMRMRSKICFWLLSYLLYHSTALESIRSEIRRSFVDPKIPIESSVNISPLSAAFNETLRLTGGASSARTVKAPTQIGNKILRKDTKLLMPYRQLHFQEEIFGSRIREFDLSRFLNDKDSSHSQSFKPFGGGVIYCSGRVIAKREVHFFLVPLLRDYDVGLADPTQSLLRLDEKKTLSRRSWAHKGRWYTHSGKAKVCVRTAELQLASPEHLPQDHLEHCLITSSYASITLRDVGTSLTPKIQWRYRLMELIRPQFWSHPAIADTLIRPFSTPQKLHFQPPVLLPVRDTAATYTVTITVCEQNGQPCKKESPLNSPVKAGGDR